MRLLAKYHRNLMFCVPSFLLVFFLFVNFGLAAEQMLTVDAMAEGLSAGEAAFTNLQFEYVSQWQIRLENGQDVIHRIEGTYAKKLSGALRYQDLKFSRINADNGDVNIISDGRASYDGNATYVLDRNVRAGKPKHGYVRPGYDPNQFSNMNLVPHAHIWIYGKKSLASIIRQNKGTFQVEQATEMIEGIPTAKLTGVIANGAFMMKLWISPERNFMPLKRQIILVKDGKLMQEMVLSNLVQLPNGLWFPKSIRFGSPDPQWASYQEISKISIDPIPEKIFTPEFPADTEVVDEVLGLRYEK